NGPLTPHFCRLPSDVRIKAPFLVPTRTRTLLMGVPSRDSGNACRAIISPCVYLRVVKMPSRGAGASFLRGGQGFDCRQDVLPTFAAAVSMLRSDFAQGTVSQGQTRAAPLLDKPILKVGHGRVRHEQGACDFQQCRRLDDLHMPPEVAGVVAKIPI